LRASAANPTAKDAAITASHASSLQLQLLVNLWANKISAAMANQMGTSRFLIELTRTLYITGLTTTD
jgi:hypothetical protein